MRIYVKNDMWNRIYGVAPGNRAQLSDEILYYYAREADRIGKGQIHGEWRMGRCRLQAFRGTQFRTAAARVPPHFLRGGGQRFFRQHRHQTGRRRQFHFKRVGRGETFA